MRPDDVRVADALARLGRARLTVAAVNGVALGALVGALLAVALWLGHASFGTTLVTVSAAILLAAVLGAGRTAMRRSHLPVDVERVAPCDNLVVTAAEILDAPTPVRADLRALIYRHAAGRLDALETKTVFPLGRPVGRGLVALFCCAAVLGLARVRPHGPSLLGPTPAVAAIRHVTITVHAPDYAGLPDRTLTDPDSVEALAGSQLRLAVDAEATAVTLETVDGRQALSPAAAGFTGTLTVSRDGFLSFEPAQGTVAGAPRAIGLASDVDHPPVVRVTNPGRDLLVASGKRHVSVALEAEDDLGLASLGLRYTRVSGSGENFTFKEGEVPLTITRTDDRHWHTVVDWNLDPLTLEPGDMVVYHGLATDRRPGAAPAESDAFIIQVATPNQADLGGFAVDDDPNRFALSQRMVILKTEQLLAKKPTLPAPELAEAALNIGAEERQVRAMFIFMLGGEFEDAAVGDALNEVAEAESEGDIAAGRLRNQARVDLASATRQMSTASTSLAVPDLPGALVAEKAALDAIQRAFTKDRYLLRAMSNQERIDLSRRLSGTLSNLAPETRPMASPEPAAVTTTLRRILQRLAAESADTSATRSTTLAAIADDCLRADPTSSSLRAVATALGEAVRERADGPHPHLDQATTALVAILAASSPHAPAVPPADLRRLDGALAALGRPGGRP